MQEHEQLSQKQINDDLLRDVLTVPKWWLPAVTFLGIIVATGLGAFSFMVYHGVGVTGLNRPVMWGFFIANFVFWIGISHAGIMISAILRLTQAEWRRPVTRAAEVMTVFSLIAALHTPLFHVGRPWRVLYWIMPYDFDRGIWPNIRSPFVWDPSAVGTYLIASTLFVLVCLYLHNLYFHQDLQLFLNYNKYLLNQTNLFMVNFFLYPLTARILFM